MRRAVGRAPAASYAGQIIQGAFIAFVAGVLCWFVWLSGSALRDAQYFDGWLLASGMLLQVYYHIRRQTSAMSPKAAQSWRQIHIFVGYVIFALFLSHSNLALPDTGFEWALWSGFLLVTASGILGTYLAWSVPAKLGPDDRTAFERIPIQRSELARQVHILAMSAEKAQLDLALPSAPYQDWIADLYKNVLRSYFQGACNSMAHFFGSQRHLKRIIAEIDSLERYVDKTGQNKLNAMKALVLEKDRLDFAHVHLGLTKLWLFVHVPITYGLVILAVLHVLVVYSYSSGVL